MLLYLGRSKFKKAKKEVFCLVSNSAFIKIKFFKTCCLALKRDSQNYFISMSRWYLTRSKLLPTVHID